MEITVVLQVFISKLRYFSQRESATQAVGIILKESTI
jgi:hypothetical protein